MPPVISYLATALMELGISEAVATWVSTLVVNAALTYGAQKLLGKKASNLGFLDDAKERTQMIRSSVNPYRLIYGRCKVSGNMVFAKETGTKREYLHLAVVLADHEVDAILDIFINDELVPFAGEEPVVGHKYRGFVRIVKHLGISPQPADGYLVAECGPDWTTDHKLSGHAYLAVRLKWDETIFTAGLPTISAIVRGKKVYDPRSSTTYWTDNPVLCIYDYMRSEFGLGALTTEFNQTRINSEANICDELVNTQQAVIRQCNTITGSKNVEMYTQASSELDGIWPGTPVSGLGIPTGAIITAVDRIGPVFYFSIDMDCTSTGNNRAIAFGYSEKRYQLNGTVDTSTKPGDVIEAMLSSMAGRVVYAGGMWHFYAGAYQTPTVTLTEDDLRGAVQMTTKLSRRELANVVKGTYISEADGWVATDFPEYAPALYLTEDGERLARDIQLPYTLSSSMGQRLAKIELERIRQQITTRWPCKLSALKVQAGDNIMLTHSRFGWTAKVFEVVSFQLVSYSDANGKPAIGVDLVLRETASGVWDWAMGEETTFDLAPNTDLHNPFIVDPPSALTLLSDSTTSWIDNDGVHVPRLKVSWTAPNDQYVLSNGRIRVQYKKNADANWIDWTLVPGDQTTEYISDVLAGTAYDVRIRSETKRGAVSAWVTSANYTVSGDLIACDTVTGLTATGLPEAIKLSWTLPDITVLPNKDLDFVEIYEQATLLPIPVAGTVATYRAGKGTTFMRPGLAAGTTMYYYARTVDLSRNKSDWSNVASAVAQNGTTYAVSQAAAAAAAASAAQTTANGKNTVFYQTTAPVSGMVADDLWYDTDDNYKLYVYNGATWVASFQPLIKLDGNNNVTGLVKADGTSKDWVMVADKFQVWNGTTAEVPFEIVGGVVYIKDAKIQHVDAGKITAGNITVGLNLTTGTFTAASGTDNEVYIDSNGLRVGLTSGSHVKLKQYVSGAAGLLLYNSSGTLKGFFSHHGGVTTLDGGTTGSDIIQGFNDCNVQNIQVLSSANPRTGDAPFRSYGGAWFDSQVDFRDEVFHNDHLNLGNACDIKCGGDIYLGLSGTNRWLYDCDGNRVIQKRYASASCPAAATDLATVITLSNYLRDLILHHGLGA